MTNRNELDDDGSRIRTQAAGVMPLDAADTLAACVEEVEVWMRHGDHREKGDE